MRSFKITSAALMTTLLAGAAFATPPNYTAVDIINWNAQQLGTLPFFKHYRPAALPVPNAPIDFHLVARTSTGLMVGNTWNVFTGPDQRGVLLSPTSASTIDSYGDFHWWRASPPATATYRITNAYDINWSGTVVGSANLPGTSVSSGAGPDMHAITYDTVHDKADILPDARYGSANCINNRGEIAGYAYGGPGPIVGGFRRSPDGQFTQLDPVPPGYHVQPLWINASGVVIGMSVPGGWASPESSTTSLLPKLFGMPLATVTDINDAGWVVGTSESWDHTEHYATLWEPMGNGTWAARDLTDLVTNLGVLLFKAWAINNDGTIIAVGQLDNGDTSPTGIYLLTPSNTRASSCVPDIGLHPVSTSTCGNGVSFSVQVVSTNAGTFYQWNKDGVPISAGSNPSAISATLTIPSVGQGDEGTYDCAVTNSCGTTTSNPATLTIGGPACCPADFDHDGFLTGDDFDAFVLQFEMGNIVADFDGDGFVTGDDFDAFVLAFEGGC